MIVGGGDQNIQHINVPGSGFQTDIRQILSVVYNAFCNSKKNIGNSGFFKKFPFTLLGATIITVYYRCVRVFNPSVTIISQHRFSFFYSFLFF